MRAPSKRDPEPKKDEDPAHEGNILSAAELKPGDRVVYPNQGVCEIVGLEQKDIAGQRLEFVRMTREEDGATVLVPIPKVASIGLRRVASSSQMEGVFHYLGASYDDPELDWKVRHRDNVERLIAGGVLGVAEVVKGLHSLARMRPLPAKERELYDSSRHLLVSEVSVSLGVPASIAEDYVDYALMPPAGVKLALRPPPRPVELKGPPWKRKKPVAAEEDDLGLAELGLDLAEIEGAAAGVGGSAEGEGEDGEKAEGTEKVVDAAPAPVAAGGSRKAAAPPARAAKPPASAKGAKAGRAPAASPAKPEPLPAAAARLARGGVKGARKPAAARAARAAPKKAARPARAEKKPVKKAPRAGPTKAARPAKKAGGGKKK